MKSFQIKNFIYAMLIASTLVFVATNKASAQRFHTHFIHNVYRPTAHFSPFIRGHAYYGGGYRVAARPYYHYGPYLGAYHSYPTIGLRFGFLPFGYYSFFLGGMPYYYANSVYYRRLNENNYEVIAPPLGAKVPQLPKGARAVNIDGNKYYEHDGTFYQEELNIKNEVLYTVVGTNGTLNQSQSPQNNSNIYHEPQVGDVYNQLPEHCELVTLNGKQYYLSPTNIFYEEIRNGNGVVYKVVGK